VTGKAHRALNVDAGAGERGIEGSAKRMKVDG
jgi:hypothetical protein